jgi:Putative metallopeptidase
MALFGVSRRRSWAGRWGLTVLGLTTALVAQLASQPVSPSAAATRLPALPPLSPTSRQLIHTQLQHLAQKSPQLAAGSGRFRVEYAPAQNPDYASYQKILQDSQLFEEIAKVLNQTLKLPHDVRITIAECGAENAFYNPQQKRLVMCDELLAHFAKTFAPTAKNDTELGEAIIYTTLFVFFHELGHGLIDVYDLPTTGREEDAVDEFSTVLLLEMGKEGEKAVLNAAHWFALKGGNQDSGSLAFWDEHSLDLQRFFGIACLAYGKDPKTFGGFVEAGILPEARADRCPEEYAKKSRSWDALLAPHTR